MSAISPQLFLKLVRLYGIGRSYWDISGKLHVVPELILERFLESFGIDLQSDQTVLEFLEHRRLESWRRGLPPVLVISQEQQPVAIQLSLPERFRGNTVHWTLVPENGECFNGEFSGNERKIIRTIELHGERFDRVRVRLNTTLPIGYYKLCCSPEAHPNIAFCMQLIITPPQSFLHPSLYDDRRVWGVTAQLYSLRSERNWGIGDFTDLKSLIDMVAKGGGSFVGLNPLHALTVNPRIQPSPYSPSSRRQYNFLYLDLEQLPDYAECSSARELVATAAFRQELSQLRLTRTVDYETVRDLKLAVLHLLFNHFEQNHTKRNTERGEAFRQFIERGGQTLREYAEIESRKEVATRDDVDQEWQVRFYQYLQWLTHLQLAEVSAHARTGLPLGLYLDLALSADSASADVRSNPSLYLRGLTVGAPPDQFNPEGQDWGFPPLSSKSFAAVSYEPFVQTLRANMKFASLLRIDHIMSFMRLYSIPYGISAEQGAYLHYRMRDLFGILCLESVRNECVVVGEDLGTVPDAVRAEMAQRGMYSYKILLFMKDEYGNFLPPEDYASRAMVTGTTHDTPTLRGYFEDGGIPLWNKYRSRGTDVEAIRRTWEHDRHALIEKFVAMGLLTREDVYERLFEAVQSYLAATPSKLLSIPLEDIVGEPRQVNLPGVSEGYPSWSHRLEIDLGSEEFVDKMNSLASRLSERGRT